jgi:murein DD-endopeptidase MepM/ murein hydrolase activator NlpD
VLLLKKNGIDIVSLNLYLIKMKKNTFIILITIASLTSFAQNSKAPFEVYHVRNQEDGSTVVYAKNNYLCVESVSIDFTALKNMEADVKIPYEGVVPAGSKAFKLLTLKIKDNQKSSQLGYISRYCHGDIYKGQHEDEYAYTLPYKEGERYAIGQAYGGDFSHNMKGKTHAIDFTMEEGTTICAARAGVVIDVKENANKHGKSIKYLEYGNYVTIYHADGSMADYFHIQKNGSKVKVGDQVSVGQEIALSGNTGWSSGPHLHFEVYSYTENMEEQTIPTKFKVEGDKIEILKESETGYKSVK